jgi:hypothetical protein
MQCEKVREKIAKNFGEQDNSPPGGELAAHLKACEPCRRERERLLLAEAALCLLGEKQPAPDLSADLLARIAETKGLRDRRRPAGWIWAAAGLVVILSAAALIARLPRPEKVAMVAPPAPVNRQEKPAVTPVTPAASPETAALPQKTVRSAAAPLPWKLRRSAALPKLRPEKQAAPAEEPVQFVEVEDHRAPENIVLLVESPQPRQSSSYLIELSRKDGSKSVRGGSIERDQAGRTRNVQIISWDTAPEKRTVEGG